MAMNVKSFGRKIKKIVKQDPIEGLYRCYKKKFLKYSFVDCECQTAKQFEASIIRLYHTIEKGLSYENYRAGFGKENIEKLIHSLEQYASNGFDISAFCYETAISCLNEYVEKNKKNGLQDTELENRINSLPGKSNHLGGCTLVSAPSGEMQHYFEKVITSRHSIRHFSDKPVSIELIKRAIELAQFSPSACNRQGWRTTIVSNKETMAAILSNQNGNRGFGHEFDKLLIITSDLRAQQKSRELFQAFIDGGMYAENVLNALFSLGIGSVPLSASLTLEQDAAIRQIAGIDDAEIFILFIGVGNYPSKPVLTTRSERKPANFTVI